VKTVLGHAGRVRAKVLVAFRSAISADDVDFGVRAADGSSGIRQDVKNPRIEVMHLSGTVVAKEAIELRQSVGKVGIAVAIHDIQTFSGMRVVKPEMAVLDRGRSAKQGDTGKSRGEDKKTNAQNVYLWTVIGQRSF